MKHALMILCFYLSTFNLVFRVSGFQPYNECSNHSRCMIMRYTDYTGYIAIILVILFIALYFIFIHKDCIRSHTIIVHHKERWQVECAYMFGMLYNGLESCGMAIPRYYPAHTSTQVICDEYKD